MKDTDFVAVSSYIRTLENRLLSKSKLESLVAMDNFLDITKALSQATDYNLTSITNLNQVEPILKEEWNRICDLLYKLTPHKEVVQIMLYPYEFHTIRKVMKKGILQSELDKELSSEMKEVLLEVDKIEGENQEKEIFLDRKMYFYMSETAKKINSDFITQQVQMKIDFYNIKTMLRAREMKKEVAFFESCFVDGGTLTKDVFLNNYTVPYATVATAFSYKYCNQEVLRGLEEYEESNNFSKLETLLQEALMKHLKKAKFISYGAEIIYAYLMAKENELRQIRLVLTCKAKHIPNSILLRKLGESYV